MFPSRVESERESKRGRERTRAEGRRYTRRARNILRGAARGSRRACASVPGTNAPNDISFCGSCRAHSLPSGMRAHEGRSARRQARRGTRRSSGSVGLAARPGPWLWGNHKAVSARVKGSVFSPPTPTSTPPKKRNIKLTRATRLTQCIPNPSFSPFLQMAFLAPREHSTAQLESLLPSVAHCAYTSPRGLIPPARTG